MMSVKDPKEVAKLLGGTLLVTNAFLEQQAQTKRMVDAISESKLRRSEFRSEVAESLRNLAIERQDLLKGLSSASESLSAPQSTGWSRAFTSAASFAKLDRPFEASSLANVGSVWSALSASNLQTTLSNSALEYGSAWSAQSASALRPESSVKSMTNGEPKSHAGSMDNVIPAGQVKVRIENIAIGGSPPRAKKKPLPPSEIHLVSNETVPEIQVPPAYRLSAIARFLLTKKGYLRYVEPHIADIHLEYYEALNAGDKKRAKWVVIRGHGIVVWALLRKVLSAVFRILEITKALG